MLWGNVIRVKIAIIVIGPRKPPSPVLFESIDSMPLEAASSFRCDTIGLHRDFLI
jgi:hypothetical protein